MTRRPHLYGSASALNLTTAMYIATLLTSVDELSSACWLQDRSSADGGQKMKMNVEPLDQT